MDPQLLQNLIAFIVGAATVAATVWATLYTHSLSDRNLEADEIRKRKVEIAYQLLGSRYVLVESYVASPDEARVFNSAMSLVPVYFGNDQYIMATYDRFVTTKSNDNLYDLLKAIAKLAGLDPLHSTISRVVTVSGALKLSLPLNNIPAVKVAGLQ